MTAVGQSLSRPVAVRRQARMKWAGQIEDETEGNDVDITYPWSRIATRNCPTCRLGTGKLVAGEPIRFLVDPRCCRWCATTAAMPSGSISTS